MWVRGGSGQGCAGDSLPHTGSCGGGLKVKEGGGQPMVWGGSARAQGCVGTQELCFSARAHVEHGMAAGWVCLGLHSCSGGSGGEGGSCPGQAGHTEEQTLSGKGCALSYVWGALQLPEWKALEEVWRTMVEGVSVQGCDSFCAAVDRVHRKM